MSTKGNFRLSIIASRYAKAFIALGEAQNLLDEFNADLKTIKETIHTNKELSTFIAHPLVSIIDKKEIIDTIFKDNISQYTLNLTKLLIDRNRIFILPLISNHFQQLLNKKRNITTAQVITAIEINEETKTKLKEKLEKLFAQQIDLETVVDEKIIAGMVVQIDEKVIDGSIKTKLEKMKKQLI